MASTPSPARSDTSGSCSSPAGGGGGGGGAEKARRYDRQLRLWGEHGQAALERAHVCLVHATATGTETLKSLVLPGVGAFTVVDDKLIHGEDVGSNFFLEKDNIGQSRGSVATRLLLEMNQEVRGNSVQESPEKILRDNPAYFQTFSLVVATDLSESATLGLSRLLWTANIPLVVVRSHGFVGYIRLQVREHTVVESHPDNVLADLRLDVPFPALVEYMDSQDLDTMDKKQHMHTPYLVILYKQLQRWKRDHGGHPPKDYKEKKEFRRLCAEGVLKKPDEDIPEDEENFLEAEKAANTALTPTTIPSNVRDIFSDDKCLNLTASSTDFWIKARAVKDFSESEGAGLLPVRGTIPDMTADSERYVRLQSVYRDRAQKDAEEVAWRVQQRLEALGRPARAIAEADVRRFCKEAAHLRVCRAESSIADEAQSSRIGSEWARMLEHESDKTDLLYYLILRATDRFRAEMAAVPGAADDAVEIDNGKLKAIVAKVFVEHGLSAAAVGPAKDELVHEICRSGAAELHSVAAFLGGCSAHEIIKLLTRQYVPVDNLVVYNAMTCQTTSVKI